jgi:hypothetical protein
MWQRVNEEGFAGYSEELSFSQFIVANLRGQAGLADV